ncbi:flagellin [Paracoccus sp. DMF-8]|uniref:flagellin n=1 Tax=Paracoccus sp. DMF-8 TaxID=3019445 RepID=UPI0023E7EFF0|nr:flagellin [Paracoccus sp. DMF-8]MDF3606485.1 flagellin [Paracoccus sp. DMF-8]
MSSILTNNSAIVALQTLKSINNNLAKTQDEISTGKSIATAKDNAAIWAISKVMEGEQTTFKTIQSNLNAAGSVVATGQAGAESVAELLKEVKELVAGATSDLMDAPARTKTQAEITRKFEQMTSIVNTTQMNGVNLLSNNTARQFLASANAGVAVAADHYISITGIDLTGTLAPAIALTITDTATAAASLALVDTALDAVLTGAATLGATAKRISDQSTFVGKLSDSLKVGVGALVDADMEEASARLQALQTQQQLGIQSLSIANQAPSSILSLFR